MNRKAQGLAGTATDAFAVITIFLILFIFFWIMGQYTSQMSASIISKTEKADADYLLVEFARTPVTYKGTDMTVAGLIDRDEEDAADLVKKTGEEFLKRAFESTGCAFTIGVDSYEKYRIENIHYASSPDCRSDMPDTRELVLPSQKGRLHRIRLSSTLGFAWDEVAI